MLLPVAKTARGWPAALIAVFAMAACGGGTTTSVPASTSGHTAVPTMVPTPTPSTAREWSLIGVEPSGADAVVTIQYFATASVKVTLDGREADEKTFESPYERLTFREIERGTHTVVARDIIGFEETMEFALGPATGPIPRLSLTSPAFAVGEEIPVRYTCDGEDISPALSWTTVPPGTETFLILVDDPDAPAGTWTHWVVFNIPRDSLGLEENQPKIAQLPGGGLQGSNSWGDSSYGGPCPPKGPAHGYRFFLYAADKFLDLAAGSTREEVINALAGHVVAEHQVTRTYGR